MQIDFDKVRPLFGGKLSQKQVDGIHAIMGGFYSHGDGDIRHLAYLLATAKHETAHTMQPIYERGAKAYFNKYEPGTKIGKTLGNTQKGDGYLFRGRGYVQLTGRANYRKFGIENDPDKALDPFVAARILIVGCIEGKFTGKRLADYKSFVSMRRVVNGTDKAAEIAAIADGFLAALSEPVQAIPKPIPAPKPADPQAPASEAPAGFQPDWGKIGIAAMILVALGWGATKLFGG